MRDLQKHEESAMEAVARRFSAKWEQRGDPTGAYLKVNGKRVAVDIATLKRPGTGRGIAAKPRLRFDKVVVWLMERLQATLAKTAPDDVTVLLTVTAPIRLPAKTAVALEVKVQALLGRGARRHAFRDVKTTLYGNRIRIRVLQGRAGPAPKMIGFVHNSETDPLLLFNMTREMLELARTQSARRAPRADLERWLVASSARGNSCLPAYRYIYSQLGMATGFKKIVVVFGDGRVGTLAG